MTALLIVLYILAGSFVLVGIVGGSGMQLEKISIPPIPHVARIVSLTFGIFFFAIALYFTAITILPSPRLRRDTEFAERRIARPENRNQTRRADGQFEDKSGLHRTTRRGPG